MDERHTIRFYRPMRRFTRKMLICISRRMSRTREKKMKRQACQSTRASKCLDSVRRCNVKRLRSASSLLKSRCIATGRGALKRARAETRGLILLRSNDVQLKEIGEALQRPRRSKAASLLEDARFVPRRLSLRFVLPVIRGSSDCAPQYK
jgi:hypothetical protein